MTTLNDEVTKLRNTVERKLAPPFRPPSCDLLTPKLNDCPLCGGKAERHERLMIIKCVNVKCNLYGPNDDPLGTKWNSIPRKSELKELLRLVQEFREFHELESIGKSASFQKMVIHADKLRKEREI